MKNWKCPTCGKFVGKFEVYCSVDMQALVEMYAQGEKEREIAMTASKGEKE